MMNTPEKDDSEKVPSESLVDYYFECVTERQRLEEEYYSTGNATLLPEIERARERIREVMKRMGADI